MIASRDQIYSTSSVRMSAFHRMFTLTEILRQVRWPASIAFLNREVNERTGENWNERTTRRDVYCLERLGLIEVQQSPINRDVRYLWRADHPFIATRPEAVRR